MALIGERWVAFPSHSQLEEAVFDMVVAGRVVGDDVAIMMVEAEATESAVELVRGGSPAPTETVVSEGLDASSRSSVSCVRRSPTWPRVRARRPGEFPVFLEFQDDAYGLSRRRPAKAGAGALTIADKAGARADAGRDQG